MTYMGVNFIHMWFNTKHHNWRWVHYITYFIFLATQISYFAPQQCYGEVHETHLEGIFRIYSGSLLRHSVAVIATCSPPPRCDLASCRTTLPCSFDLHSTSNLGCLPAAMRNQNVYPYWLRLQFLRKRVVARCHFERAPSFPAHNFFYWSHMDSWLVTNFF